MIRITWNRITLLLLVLACSILFFVCSKSKKYEPIQQPTTEIHNLETKIQNLIALVDSLKSNIKTRVETKEKITTYYHTVLKRNEDLPETVIDSIYLIDTISSHEIAGHIERANYFEQLYTEQTGIDSIRQLVINNLDKVTETQATEIKVLKTEKIQLEKKVKAKSWLLKTVSTLGVGAIIYAIIK